VIVLALAAGHCAVAQEPAKAEGKTETVRVSGRIVSPAGIPILSRNVVFRRLMGARLKDSTVSTDKDGRFVFDAELRAEYEVRLELSKTTSTGIGTFVIADGSAFALGDMVMETPAEESPFLRFAGPVKVDGTAGKRSAHGSARNASGGSIAALYFDCGTVASHFCGNGTVHILLGDGSEVKPPRLKDQVQSSHPIISDSKTAAGWLADYDGCCQSYPLSMKLVIYRVGKAQCEFTGDGRGIFGWHFLKDGKQVAFNQDFTHGTSYPHYELRNVENCGLLDMQDGDADKPPAWVSEFDGGEEN